MYDVICTNEQRLADLSKSCGLTGPGGCPAQRTAQVATMGWNPLHTLAMESNKYEDSARMPLTMCRFTDVMNSSKLTCFSLI